MYPSSRSSDLSGLTAQFVPYWLNSRCSIGFHFGHPGGA
jgi:hypothetical protein